MISDAAVLTRVPKVGPKAYKYFKGISLLDECPSQDEMTMNYDDDYPEGIKLYDILSNIRDLIVANSKVKECLDGLGVANVEYIPISLLNHKKELVSQDYFILNPLCCENIIDMDKSEYRMDPLDEGQIASIDNMVVDFEQVAESAKFFRASKKKDSFFITDDVKQAFEAAEITGYKLFEAEGWDGLDI